MGNFDARECRNRLGTGTCGASSPRRNRPLFYLSGPAFLLLLFTLVRLGKLPSPFFYAYMGSSIACFLLYGADKRAAREKRRRVMERTLHLAGLLGGWPGAILAQRLFHHKSQKTSFQFLFRATVLANCAALALIAFHAPAVWRWFNAAMELVTS